MGVMKRSSEEPKIAMKNLLMPRKKLSNITEVSQSDCRWTTFQTPGTSIGASPNPKIENLESINIADSKCKC